VGAAAVQIESFRPALQSCFRQLVLTGLAEHWGDVDEALNPDLDDVASFYQHDIFLVAVGGEQLVGTGILLLSHQRGRSCACRCIHITGDWVSEPLSYRHWFSRRGTTELIVWWWRRTRRGKTHRPFPNDQALRSPTTRQGSSGPKPSMRCDP
jgi:hypothetical protein